MQFKTVAIAAIMAGITVAQTNSTAIPPVDPGSVDAQTKASWCIGQRSACETLCDEDAPTNNCDPTLLTFECLCADESVPPLEEYKDTMPDRICLTAYAQCIESRPDDALGQTACKEDILSQCGTKSITDYESGSGGSGSGSSTEEPDSEETTDSSDENTDQETTPTDDESTPSSTDAAPTTTTSDGAGATLSAEKGIAFIAAGLVAALL